MNTEKITLNMNAMDLADIDLLVENGFAANRSELMKTAIKSYLANRENETKELIEVQKHEAKINHWHWFFGFNKITERYLKEKLLDNQIESISSYGTFTVDKDVSLDLMKQCVKEIKIHGTFKASKEIKDYYKKRK